jgi:hypothetical protein
MQYAASFVIGAFAGGIAVALVSWFYGQSLKAAVNQATAEVKAEMRKAKQPRK